jgi:hypothetical protein
VCDLFAWVYISIGRMVCEMVPSHVWRPVCNEVANSVNMLIGGLKPDVKDTELLIRLASNRVHYDGDEQLSACTSTE